MGSKEKALTAAIILAGGKGSRMQSEIPKQYMKINGRPVIYYALEAFSESSVDKIVLVTGNACIDGMDEKTYCIETNKTEYNSHTTFENLVNYDG